MLEGKVPSVFVLIVTGLLAPGTILTCYYFAVTLGHVQPWPYTDISHCAVHSPEKFIFRIGMIPSCCGIAIAWYFISRWIAALHQQIYGSRSSGYRFTLRAFFAHIYTISVVTLGNLVAAAGAVGSSLLIVAAAVLESDASAQWGLHSACATSFFAISIIGQTIVTVELYLLSAQLEQNKREMPLKTNLQIPFLWIKAAINVTSIVMMLADAFLFKQGTVIDNIFEWSMVTMIIAYHGSFIYDWWNVFYEESDIKAD